MTPSFEPLAEDVYRISWGVPPSFFNVYLLGDVLVDTGTRRAAGRILRALRGRRMRAVALTHVHPDHQGSAARICSELRIPLWCGERDGDAMEAGRANWPDERWPRRLSEKAMAGPAHPVERRLHEGDNVSDFVVLETPGHSPGHLSFWRERDRTIILGELVTNEWLRLKQPIRVLTTDPAENRRSARRIADLEPALVCFAHGRPLRDPRRLREFVEHF